MYVYFLRCRDGTLYTGITSDLLRRLRQHRGELPGGAKYTIAHPPLGYAAAWEVPDRRSALQLEYRLKQRSKAQKEALIAGEDVLEFPRAPVENPDTSEIGS